MWCRPIALVVILSVLGLPAFALDLPQIPVAKSERVYGHPHDVELSPDGKHLYVADLDNDRVAVLDAWTLKLVSTIGENELASPHDLTFAHDGRLLVADTANDRIAVYTLSTGTDGNPTGKLTASWNSGMASPEGVTINAKGDVFVGNTGWGSVVIVRRGRAVGALAEPAPGKGAFRRPHDVMIARDGRLFVVDSGNHRIVVFGKDLKLSKILHGPPYDFSEPKYLAEGDDGLIYVADEHNNRVLVLDTTLKPVGTIGSGAKGDADGQLNWPEGVFVKGPDIWVADTYNNRILRFRRN